MRHYFLLPALAILTLSAFTVLAQTKPAKPGPTTRPNTNQERKERLSVNMDTKVPANYQAATLPAFIAPTAAINQQGNPEVFGEPRNTQGHPCTLWDNDDIAHYKDMLKTSKPLQDQLAALKADMDKRIAEPLGVPEPKKGPDGKWVFPGAPKDIHKAHEANSRTISNLGLAYALTGDAKYGEFAHQMLVAYADTFPKYGHPDFKGNPWTPTALRSAMDGRLTGQFLEDGSWLIPVAQGYDLVYNLPSWTDDQRRQMREGLFEPIAAFLMDDILGPKSYLDATHNRSAICAAGVLMAGYACDSQKLIDAGLYGKNGTKEKPLGGVFGIHFTTQCISADGLWNEGSMGYQAMARAALVDDAEVMWHHGVNLYSYNHAILKGLFDSPFLILYPDLTEPEPHDSHRGPFTPDQLWNDDGPHTYEYAYRRYHDPRYLVPIDAAHVTLHLSIHNGPPSVLFDQNLEQKPAVTNNDSTNFFDCGYGIMRVTTGPAPTYLLLNYGPSRSHGHADKLSLDLFAQGDCLVPDPGIVFPYNYPLDGTWYRTTAGHATVTVDQKDQLYFGNKFMFRNLPDPVAQQLVFAPAATLVMQRAHSDTIQPGLMEDRALFLTADYLADIFGAFSSGPHTYDLSWHLRGKLETALPLQPTTFPADLPGYGALKEVKHATTDQAYQFTATFKDHPFRLLAAAAPGEPKGTELIVGNGFYRLGRDDEIVPAIYQRRVASSTLFGNALDLSAGKDPYVKSVAQEGSLDDGYGLLKVQTAKGTDLCFAAFRPGTYKTAGLETDAAQACVLMDGETPRVMYLAGKSLQFTAKALPAGPISLVRSEPGLACLERLPSGVWVLSNASPTAATITLTFPALANIDPVTLDAAGQPAKTPAKFTRTAAALTVDLPANSKVQFSAK